MQKGGRYDAWNRRRVHVIRPEELVGGQLPGDLYTDWRVLRDSGLEGPTGFRHQILKIVDYDLRSYRKGYAAMRQRHAAIAKILNLVESYISGLVSHGHDCICRKIRSGDEPVTDITHWRSFLILPISAT
jgi:hypothetical protein